MPAFSNEFLATVARVTEPLAYGAGVVAAISGLLYMLANRPLQRVADERQEATRLEIAKTAERAAKLEIDAEQQRERAANAERELLKLKTRRTLTDDQRRQLVAHLKPEGPKCAVSIETSVGDSESQGFAHVLDSGLKEAGWESGVLLVDFVGQPTGIVLVQKTRGRAVPCVARLEKGLSAIGLATTGAVDPTLPRDTVRLKVGSKP